MVKGIPSHACDNAVLTTVYIYKSDRIYDDKIYLFPGHRTKLCTRHRVSSSINNTHSSDLSRHEWIHGKTGTCKQNINRCDYIANFMQIYINTFVCGVSHQNAETQDECMQNSFYQVKNVWAKSQSIIIDLINDLVCLLTRWQGSKSISTEFLPTAENLVNLVHLPHSWEHY